ncbi:MAG: DoxX family protein [Candidatus Marinimicrobia bacterium]|nr:DoxX family protein [Candidatus Neomarinimicrobiota bacterium]
MKKLTWIIQGIIIFAFLGAGTMKMTQPIEQIAEQMNWVNYFQPWMIRAIGFAQALGAMGLILPMVIKPIPSQLTVYAGAGLSLLMLGAIGTHIVIGEATQILPPTILFLLSGFVTWKRKAELL